MPNAIANPEVLLAPTSDAHPVRRAVRRCAVWRERIRMRRARREMDDRMLADIGIDRSVTDREASKPWWRA
jgi:uncharacterized protein YjiS (DUF1127 family)